MACCNSLGVAVMSVNGDLSTEPMKRAIGTSMRAVAANTEIEAVSSVLSSLLVHRMCAAFARRGGYVTRFMAATVDTLAVDSGISAEIEP